jgi:hypothetical protein
MSRTREQNDTADGLAYAPGPAYAGNSAVPMSGSSKRVLNVPQCSGNGAAPC